MSSRALRLSLVGLALLLAVTELAGQRTCDLTSSRRLESIQTNDGYTTYISAPRIECDDGTRIRADSSVYFEATSFYQLFGSVVFQEEGRELVADRAQYFERVGQLQAQGSVRLENLDDGSWVTGDDLLLLQEGDARVEDDVMVRGGRPRANIVSKRASDSTDITPRFSQAPSPTQDPLEISETTTSYEVDADLIHMVGDRLFQARGGVEVRQETLQSYGDSLEFQQDIGFLTLFDNARILSQDTVSGDTLDVRGDTITMNLPDNQIDEIEALGRAHLLGNDIEMRAPVIRLAFVEEELERVFAVRRAVEEGLTPASGSAEQVVSSADQAQPEAFAEEFHLTGDSIEAYLPEGGLERVFSAGTALGVSSARDSLNTPATEEFLRDDWISGDTIIATFQSVSADSGYAVVSADAGQPGVGGAEVTESSELQLELLIALGQGGRAKAYYRAAPDSVAPGAPEPPPLDLHYVMGDEVRLLMRDGEVDRMEVVNPTGVVLRPTSPQGLPAAAPDSSVGAPAPPGVDDAPPTGGNGPPDGPLNGVQADGGNGNGDVR